MRLGKMCYGLKQAAWVFHEKVRKTLLDIGYQPTLFDACLYFIFVTEGDRQYLVLTAVYVDNFNTAAEREEDAVHYDAEIGKRIDSRVEDPNDEQISQDTQLLRAIELIQSKINPP